MTKEQSKLQAAVAMLRRELRLTNDDKFKLKDTIAEYYVRSEPETRRGRQAFKDLNLYKDQYREILKIEENLRTLLYMAKEKGKAIAAKEARMARVNVHTYEPILAATDYLHRTKIAADAKQREIIAGAKEARESAHNVQELAKFFDEIGKAIAANNYWVEQGEKAKREESIARAREQIEKSCDDAQQKQGLYFTRTSDDAKSSAERRARFNPGVLFWPPFIP